MKADLDVHYANDKNHLCQVERAWHLDNRFRRWLQNPYRILSPYIREGITVLDFGCGPGYFTVDIAKMVGKSGRVIAADLQEEMLWKLRHKIDGTGLSERITLHKCKENRIGLREKVDFALAFYVVHEVPSPKDFFEELESILQPGGQSFIVEPIFRVSNMSFLQTIETARKAGFKSVKGPKVVFSKTMILKKS